MKVFILLSAFLACACAEGLEGGYGGHYAAPALVSKVVHVNTGTSSQSRTQDASGNYAFSYDEQHQDGAWGSGGSSRHETGDAWGNKEGSYSLNVGDGRQRIVKYVADGAGFRASIKTNEPGIVASQPAAVDINTPHGYGPALAPAVVATNVGGYSEGGLSYGASNLHGYGAGLIGAGHSGALLGGHGLGVYSDGGLALGGAALAGGWGAGLAGAYKK